MRVLVVEDDADLAEGLRLGLEGEGFAVDVAGDGLDGLWYAQENPYDVMILDVMLPEIDGFELCRRLRQAENWTPVLFLTARDGTSDQVAGLDLGGDDYLAKPVAFAVLLARLRALVRRGGTARPTVIEVAGIRFDPASRQAWRAGALLDLTSRELAVLEFFLRRPGQVVSKLDVLAGVWDEAFDGDPNIVEVYLSRLRRKIDRPFGRASLETVRGSGYRLADDDG
ncbi:MAG: response regulator transcription factor [Propionibacteriaceae bacterium]|jgi:DNA-binding response OmpR family regulator|nr:response regulator transcription factor [Propionibacteriaceae bacterium]